MTDTVTKDTAVTTDAVTTAKPSTSTSRAKKKTDPAAEREKAVAALSFEEAIARLEVVVRTMEGDAVTLEESLALYEEGVALCRRCQGELEAAEQRVKILKRTPEGDIRPDDFPTVE